jgi:hypothetical protein
MESTLVYVIECITRGVGWKLSWCRWSFVVTTSLFFFTSFCTTNFLGGPWRMACHLLWCVFHLKLKLRLMWPLFWNDLSRAWNLILIGFWSSRNALSKIKFQARDRSFQNNGHINRSLSFKWNTHHNKWHAIRHGPPRKLVVQKEVKKNKLVVTTKDQRHQLSFHPTPRVIHSITYTKVLSILSVWVCRTKIDRYTPTLYKSLISRKFVVQVANVSPVCN